MAINTLTPQIVDALLDKLSNDDPFRALFATDPHTALEALGYRHPADCMRVQTLASKEDIQAAQTELREQLLAKELAFIIHRLGG